MAIDALPKAVNSPARLDARTDMLLASYYAGCAIHLCSTSIAHALSHALARLAPVNHGLATALAFEITLPFILSAQTEDMQKAVSAFGVSEFSAMPDALSKFMDQLGIEWRLPEAFDKFSAEDLMPVLLSDEIQPMRQACVVYANDEQLFDFAKALLR